MPLYEYECGECSFRFELKRRFSEDGGKSCCPRCQGEARRIFCPSAIVFKGPGFYVTDHRKNNEGSSESPKKEPGKTEPGKAGSGKAGSGKAEAGKPQSGKAESAKAEASKKSESK